MLGYLIRKLWRLESFDAKKLTGLALKKLSSAGRADDLFIWLHYFDSHMPYFAPKKYISYYLKNKRGYFDKLGEGEGFLPKRDIQSGDINNRAELVYNMAAYHASLTYIDENIGRLVAHLKAAGEYDDSMIIVTADHGENLFENGVVCGHNKLYDETTWVPLIIKFPQNSYQGQTCSLLVELVDIYPTILSQIGIDLPEKIRGVDLISYLKGENVAGKAYVLTEHFGNFQRSIRDRDWQLIESMPPEKWRGIREEKFRLEIAEKMRQEGDILLARRGKDKNNYSASHPAVVAGLKKEAERILERR